MDLSQLARVLAVLGLILLVIAGGLYLLSRLDISIGKIPGDIQISRGNITCVIPLILSLLISIILTILLNLLITLIRK
ncbi:MAG: DUF2905 family protein [Anaerolineales bacterium]